MIVLALEEFTAKRRKAQTDLETLLEPDVRKALDTHTDTSGWDELLETVSDLYERTYAEESGDRPRKPDTRWINNLRETLRKTKPPRDEPTVDRITVWLATAILSEATEQAAVDDPEELFLEWVTMEDREVRASHKATHGQTRPAGEKFDVDGVKMPYPGWSGAPIEEWINCRCTIRPTLAADVLTAAGVVGQTDPSTHTGGEMADEEKDLIEQVPEDFEVPVEHVTVPWYSVLAPEGVWSGDRRRFAEGTLRSRPLPLPITWQKTSADGHDGNVTVAKVEQIMRVGKEIRGAGHFLMIPEADEVAGLIADFGRFGISIDADDVAFEFDEDEEGITFTDGRVASACIVPIPAFHQAFIAIGEPPEDFFTDGAELEVDRTDEALVASGFADIAPGKTEDGPGWLTHPVDTDRLRDYWVRGAGAAKINWGAPGDFNRCRSLVAEYVKPQHINGYCANRHYDALGFWPGEHHSAAIEALEAESMAFTGEAITFRKAIDVLQAPAEWFKEPDCETAEHLTVTEEGRVFGFVADWTTCHSDFSGECVLAPHSASDYAHFATGQVLTTEGMVRTGPITIGGPHARMGLGMRAAQAHYDNTTTAVADVAIGENDKGIWVAGWIRPGTTPEQVAALRASDVSGDWREAPGRGLELIAVLGVNHGGFALPRMSVGMRSGRQVSLVAAGVIPQTNGEREKVAETYDLEALADALADAIERREERKKKLAALAAWVNGDE